MNPEFRRQLWLQFSTTRLVLMPALIVLGSLAVALSAGQEQIGESLFVAAQVAFLVVVYGMGTNAAGASIQDEIQERTWDQQRMSAMRPWAMTWGKLLGATSYAWYGGALCLLVLLPAATLVEQEHLAVTVGCALLGGVLLHAMVLVANLQLAKNSGRMAQRGAIWVVLVMALWGVGFSIDLSRSNTVSWWAHDYEPWSFLFSSLLFFAICALVAAWRLMAESLAVGQLPWGWPILILTMTVYFGGFMAVPLSLVGLGLASVLTYASQLSQPQTRASWQRLLAQAEVAHWRSVLMQLPPWLISLILLQCFAVIAMFQMSGVISSETSVLFGGKPADAYSPLVIALLGIRDCCLLLFFSFNPRARRPLGAFMITLLMLYVLLPWLFSAMDIDLLTALVSPLYGTSSIRAGFAALHALAAFLLLKWQWTRTRPATVG